MGVGVKIGVSRCNCLLFLFSVRVAIDGPDDGAIGFICRRGFVLNTNCMKN
jgi:hypothetical protein